MFTQAWLEFAALLLVSAALFQQPYLLLLASLLLTVVPAGWLWQRVSLWRVTYERRLSEAREREVELIRAIYQTKTNSASFLAAVDALKVLGDGNLVGKPSIARWEADFKALSAGNVENTGFVTLAFNMIVKSVVENVDAVGGARGFLGMISYHFQIQELYGGKRYQNYDDAEVAAARVTERGALADHEIVERAEAIYTLVERVVEQPIEIGRIGQYFLVEATQAALSAVGSR